MHARIGRRRLVLVGGGHAHVQVLRSWAMRPVEDVELVVVVDRPVAVYSGMVPALVAGEIPAHDVQIDVRPLARRAGATVVMAPALSVDAEAGQLAVSGRAPMAYDLISLDIGSTVAHADLPGVREHALASRPIADLITRMDGAVDDLARRGGTARVVVVGAGAGGVELAFCTEARLAAAGLSPEVTLLSSDEALWPHQPAVARHLARAMASRSVRFVGGRRATEVTAEAVHCDDGTVLPADRVLWVTGAAALPLGRASSGLSTDDRGFLRIRETLQVVGRDRVFAVGDCAVLDDHRWVPRAGVYAVRQGPVLDRNLRAWLRRAPLERYRPQSDFLSMLNLGDRTAIATKWGRAVRGRWVWRWKDRIDRRFMDRFQVLGPDGAPREAFAEPMEGAEAMACGGCAAKVGPQALDRVLSGEVHPEEARDDVLVGLADRDDAAVVRLGGAAVSATVDVFPAFTDDPWVVGTLAVRHAVADLVAGGARPRHALAVAAVPEGPGGVRWLTEAMAAARRALAEEGVALVGGHTGLADRPTLGFTVLGEPSEAPVEPVGPGDALVLTRALGTGVLWRADGLGLAAGPWVQAALAQRMGPMAPLGAVVARPGVRRATDVTGFGLAGHLPTLLGPALGAVLQARDLPVLPGVAGLLRRGVRSTAHEGLAATTAPTADPGVDAVARALVVDPQTAGGLLLAVAPGAVQPVVDALRAAGETHATVVGHVVARAPQRGPVHLAAPPTDREDG